MKKLQTLALAMLIAGAASAQTWKLDKNHAKLGFTVTHLLMSDVDGAFTSFDMKITSAKDDFSDAVIELTADVKSINTNQEGRDKDLRSPKYFNADTFPTLTFKSKALTKVEGQKYKLTGDAALVLLARIVNGADTDNSLWNQPESWGLKAIAEGFRGLGFKDDHELNAAEWIVYDALYAYCKQMVAEGRLAGAAG